MSKLARRIALACCLAWLSLHHLQAQPVRFALIAEGAEARKAADLLTVEFSRSQEMMLLERAEIERVYRELALSVDSAGNALKAGQLLGADGLLIISPDKPAATTALDFRMIAVKPGVVLDAFRQTWPVTNHTEWSGMMSRQFSPSFPKLRILGTEAVPLSVLNFHSSVRNLEANQLENDLTLLVINRLTREQDLFVLERRGLQRAQLEKEFTPAEEQFWSGRYLLEGTLDASGYQQDTVVVSGRLLPPGGASPLLFEVSGPRNEPATVASAIAVKALELLKKKPTELVWQPSLEAERYFEEARWSYRWGMTDVAQTACETAWALGNHTLDLSALRVRSFISSIQLTAEEISRSPFAPPRFLRPPDPLRLQPTQHALEIFLDYSRKMPPGVMATNQPWHTVGLELAQAAAIRVGYYHQWYRKAPDLRAKYDERLAAFRQELREVAAILDTQMTNPDMVSYWARVKASYAKHWCDTPEQAFPYFTSMLTSTEISSIRVGLRANKDLLTAWRPEDEARLPEVWTGFIERWCASTNPVIRFEGLVLHLGQTMPDEASGWPAWNKEFKAFLDFSLAQCSDHLFLDYDRSAMQEAVKSVYFWAQMNKSSVVHRQEMGLMHDEFNHTVDAHKPANLYANMREHILTGNSYDEAKFTGALTRKYNMGQALELLPALAKYQTRVGPDAEKVAPLIHLLEAYLISIKHPLPSVEVPAPPPPSPAPPLPASVVDGSFSGSQVLELKRVWQPDVSMLGEVDVGPQSIVTASYRDGRMWVLCKFSRKEFGKSVLHAVLFSVSPETLETEAVLLPELAGVYHQPTLQYGFDVTEKEIYVSAWGKLACYNRSSRKWRFIPLPLSEDTTVFADGTHVYLGGTDTLLELDPLDGSSRILASSRRRPAVSALDELPGYGQPTMSSDGNGTVVALIQGARYFYDLSKNLWSIPPKGDPTSWRLLQITGQRVLLWKQFTMFPVNMLYQADLAGRAKPLWMPGAGASVGARWSAWLPPFPALSTVTAAISDGRLCLFQLKAKAEPFHRLWVFDDRWEKPFEVPLKLFLDRTDPYGNPIEWEQGQTPKVLDVGVGHAFFMIPPIAGHAEPTIWFMTAEQLQAYLQKYQPRNESPRRDYVLRQKFDLNKNGWLDPDEIARLRADPAYQKEEPGELTELLGRLAENLLANYDFDHDQKLDALEQNAMIVYETSQPTFSGAVFLRYDINSDHVLDLEEIKIFAARLQRINKRIGLPPRLVPAFAPPWLGPDGQPISGKALPLDPRMLRRTPTIPLPPGVTPSKPAP